MGTTQRRRTARAPVDGVLVLDKPAGLSSNAAMLWARRLLDAPKAGHGGTLDPLATGVLPVLLGEATKFAADLLDADKVYEATLALGVTTTTGDAEGEILTRALVAADADAVRAACAAFVGEIEQVPPMHSALKRDGRPLYEYARDGVTLERQARRVRIHALDVLEMALDGPDPRVRLRVHCSKGTYVRTLAEDIGQRLGCGAHLAALRRTGAGVVSIGQAVTPQALEALSPDERAACLLPVDALLQSLARVELSGVQAARFAQGQRIGIDPAAIGPDAAVTDPDVATIGSDAAAIGSNTAASGLDAAAIGSDAIAAGPAAARVRVYAQGQGQSRLLGVATLQPGGVLAPLRLVAQTGQTGQPGQPIQP